MLTNSPNLHYMNARVTGYNAAAESLSVGPSYQGAIFPPVAEKSAFSSSEAIFPKLTEKREEKKDKEDHGMSETYYAATGTLSDILTGFDSFAVNAATKTPERRQSTKKKG